MLNDRLENYYFLNGCKRYTDNVNCSYAVSSFDQSQSEQIFYLSLFYVAIVNFINCYVLFAYITKKIQCFQVNANF